MGFLSILSFAHQCVADRVTSGDTVIDATIGNGNDTLFLARLVGESGMVYGFDIQEQAIRKTADRLNKELPQSKHIRLHLHSHAQMSDVIPHEAHGKVAAVMFNLGYLPGEDHAVITRPESTIPALEAALALLKEGGVVTIVVYPGHEGGDQEASAVTEWCGRLPQDRYQVLQYQFINQKNRPPYVVAIEKRQIYR